MIWTRGSPAAGPWSQPVTSRRPAATDDLEEILRRIEAARDELVDALTATDSGLFEKRNADGESLKGILERTVDDVNFYYARLVARALSLPQPPCLHKAEFSSLREATISLQVAHRRFSNLLHDLRPEDLDKRTSIDGQPEYTLRQVLELAAAHYRLRLQQVQALAGVKPRRGRKKS